MSQHQADVLQDIHADDALATAEAVRGAGDHLIQKLQRWIHCCGFLIFAAYIAMIPLSFGIAPVSPRSIEQPAEEVALRAAVDAIPGLSATARHGLQRYVSGESIFQSVDARALAYFLPLFLITTCALLVFVCLRRFSTEHRQAVTSILFRWSIAFGVANVFIYPMTTQDFWLSVAWGRMTAAGNNPYYAFFTNAALENLPLVESTERMTYGPLWALISGLVAFVARGHVLFEFVAFKLLLAASWLVTVLLLRRITRVIASGREAFSVWILGWLPLTLHMVVAEGHNDIVLVLFVVTWLFLLASGRMLLSPVALAGSFLVKYITAPLVALEILHAWSQPRRNGRAYLLALMAVGLGSLLLFLPFFRDRHMFDSVIVMRNWLFWTPASALVHASAVVGLKIPRAVASQIVLGICGLIIMHAVIQYRRASSLQNLAAVALAGLTAILMGVVGHVWPWFLVWLIPLCVIVRREALVTFILVLAILGPSFHWHWIAGSGPSIPKTLGTLIYAIAALASAGVLLVNRFREPSRFSVFADAG